jgi:hypothetical protein
MSKFQQPQPIDQEDKKPEKNGYGLKPKLRNFSHKAGQKLRECGAAIDILCEGSVEKCRVITLTLPSSETAAYTAMSEWSGYITNRLLQIIRREKDDRYHWFYVWEHQRRGALHLHLCLYHEESEQSDKLGQRIVSKWRDILCDVSRLSNVDLLYAKGFGRRVESHEMQSLNQQMHKGCGAYFSKYAGKTSSARSEKNVDGIDTINARKYPPSSFWGRSQNLARLCEAHSFCFRYEGAHPHESEALQEEALNLLSQFDIVMNRSFSFKKEIELKGNGMLTIAEGESLIFYLSPEDYAKALDIFVFMYSGRATSAIPERSKNRPTPDKAPMSDVLF